MTVCETLKVAVADSFAAMVTVHVLLPVHAPAQPAKKDDPLLAVAVSFTFVPELKLAVQVAPQLMPAGVLVTCPLPLPANVTLSWNELVDELACGPTA